MDVSSIVTLLLLVAALFVSTPLLGRYMARVYRDDETGGPAAAPGDRVFGPVERLIYRLLRVDVRREQRWTGYAMALLAFSFVSVVALYVLQRVQELLPFNPTNAPGVDPALAWNTAVSFVSNTNWQNYSGESTMAHLTQMAGLTVQNFVSAAVGMAVAVALIRGLARRGSATIGNFWVDLTRTITRILLPLSLVVAVILVSQGAIQSFRGYTEAATIDQSVTYVDADGVTQQVSSQQIPGGPFASQEAIKELGTNGGGTLNANSIHPLSNPDGVTNFLENWALLSIPFAFAYAFGILVRSKRQGWAVFGVMFVIWLAASVLAMGMEATGNPRLTALGANQAVSASQSGGNFEGKDVRIGAAAAGLWAASTTGTSTGAVNGQHDSFTALGGGVALLHMKLGEVSPGGVGVGLNGLLILALLSVFIAGLMVGPHPGVPGQEDPGAGDEAGRPLHPGDADRGVELRGGVGPVGLRGREDRQPRPPRPQRDPLRVRLGRQQQRLRRSAVSAGTPSGTTPPWGWPCWPAGSS